MATLDVLKHIRFVTDSEGRRVGVLLDIRAWDSLIDWIENATNAQVAIKALTELHIGGGPRGAGWVPWDAAREKWE